MSNFKAKYVEISSNSQSKLHYSGRLIGLVSNQHKKSKNHAPEIVRNYEV